MKRVFEKLQLLEISAATSKKEAAKMVQPSTELIERVIRRAEELRRAWAGPEATSSRQQASSQAARQLTVS
jgi:transposase